LATLRLDVCKTHVSTFSHAPLPRAATGGCIFLPLLTSVQPGAHENLLSQLQPGRAGAICPVANHQTPSAFVLSIVACLYRNRYLKWVMGIRRERHASCNGKTTSASPQAELSRGLIAPFGRCHSQISLMRVDCTKRLPLSNVAMKHVPTGFCSKTMALSCHGLCPTGKAEVLPHHPPVVISQQLAIIEELIL
jgi:hypothetical protein